MQTKKETVPAEIQRKAISLKQLSDIVGSLKRDFEESQTHNIRDSLEIEGRSELAGALQNCNEELNELDRVLQNAFPQPGDNLERHGRAFRVLIGEDAIQNRFDQLQESVNRLIIWRNHQLLKKAL